MIHDSTQLFIRMLILITQVGTIIWACTNSRQSCAKLLQCDWFQQKIVGAGQTGSLPTVVCLGSGGTERPHMTVPYSLSAIITSWTHYLWKVSANFKAITLAPWAHNRPRR